MCPTAQAGRSSVATNKGSFFTRQKSASISSQSGGVDSQERLPAGDKIWAGTVILKLVACLMIDPTHTSKEHGWRGPDRYMAGGVWSNEKMCFQRRRRCQRLGFQKGLIYTSLQEVQHHGGHLLRMDCNCRKIFGSPWHADKAHPHCRWRTKLPTHCGAALWSCCCCCRCGCHHGGHHALLVMRLG